MPSKVIESIFFKKRKHHFLDIPISYQGKVTFLTKVITLTRSVHAE
jgi:predicted nucleic-acid-binding protein